MISEKFSYSSKISTRLALTFILLISHPFACSNNEYHLWYTPGQMQAIGNENELWLFFEIDQMAFRPNAGCDTPKSIPIGHLQEIVILTKDGLKSRFRVPVDNGITFHPNITHIFGLSDKLYLYSGESALYKESIFRWEDDHFKLLSIEESDSFISKNISKDKKITLNELKKIIPANEAEKIYNTLMKYHRPKDGKITIPFGIYLDLYDLLSEKYGWKYFSGNMFCCDDNIKWNGLDIKIKASESDKDFNINLKSRIFNNETSSISLLYDKKEMKINSVDYKKIRNRQKQEAHKKELKT